MQCPKHLQYDFTFSYSFTDAEKLAKIYQDEEKNFLNDL